MKYPLFHSGLLLGLCGIILLLIQCFGAPKEQNIYIPKDPGDFGEYVDQIPQDKSSYCAVIGNHKIYRKKDFKKDLLIWVISQYSVGESSYVLERTDFKTKVIEQIIMSKLIYQIGKGLKDLFKGKIGEGRFALLQELAIIHTYLFYTLLNDSFLFFVKIYSKIKTQALIICLCFKQ